MRNNPIRIVLIDDHKLVRSSWKILLESNEQFKIVADFEYGADTGELVNQLNPDIVLVDINMTPKNGLDLTESLI
jgi:DNA-binding NarL/FixJ family response regulator